MLDREWVADFIDTHRIKIAAVLGAVLLLLIAVLAVSVMKNNAVSREAERVRRLHKSRAFRAGELFLPPEPLTPPGVILSRDVDHIWTLEEAASYFSLPEPEAQEALRLSAQKQIDDILESVP